MRSLWALTAAVLCLGMVADDDAKLLPDGPGKEAVIRVCTTCHGPANFRKARLSRDDWSDKIADMVERGAKGSDEDLAAVTAYLVQNFGEDSKVWVNTAPLQELKSVLGLSVDEAAAIIGYRQEKGNFKEWRDLLKVPGVDAKKVEARKDLMAF